MKEWDLFKWVKNFNRYNQIEKVVTIIIQMKFSSFLQISI